MTKTTTTTSPKTPVVKTNEHYKLWSSRIALALIILFAIFLRYEDFSVWQKNKAAFQYQGEYEMANYDSYYYLKIAKELKEGTYNNPQEKRHVPNGMEAPTIPPLIAILAASISSVTTIPVSTVAIFLPVFLASLLAPLMFLLCVRLKFHKIAALTAALFSIISLTYIVRTRIGVFDTDCLNVVFALLNSYLFLRFAEIKDKKRYRYLALGLLSTFLFYIWWNTATSVVLISAVVPLFVAVLFFYQTKNKVAKYSFLAAVLLICAWLIGDQLLAYFNILFQKTNTVFPNNMSVSELNAVSIADFITATTGNVLLFAIMCIGIVLLVWKLKLKALFFAIPFLLGIAALFAGNRFVLFAAPILALGMGYVIQLLFNYKEKINPKLAYGATLLLVIIGIASNYKKITVGYAKTSAYENVALLSALDKFTPKDANIWTEWDLGYQIQYYLDRGTYADGEFSDGEIYYYVSFPFAAENLAVSANFMRFYNKNGKAGMKVLFESFSGVVPTFEFLNEILSLSPSEAEQLLIEKQQKGTLPKTKDISTPKDWISFIFPKESEDIYVFLHYKMTQTASWFKQGHSDLKTGETIGLPLFLSLSGLQQQGNQIKNNQIDLNATTGIATYFNEKRYFQSLSTYNGVETETNLFPLPVELKSQFAKKDERFVFQWNEQVGFGAAMSKEMSNTTLVKLYLLQEESPYFTPVLINTPQYQIWKVTGSAYDIE